MSDQTLPFDGDEDALRFDGDDHTPRSAEGSSRDAGEYLSRSEKTRQLKRDVWGAVSRREDAGMTVKEFTHLTGVHHGQVSGAFSTMHQAGYLARLQERRAKYEVYVLPEHVNGRPTREHASIARARKHRELTERVEAAEHALSHYPQLGMTMTGRMVEAQFIALIDTVNKHLGRDQ